MQLLHVQSPKAYKDSQVVSLFMLAQKLCLNMLMKLTPGVNFNIVLLAAESVKKTDNWTKDFGSYGRKSYA